MTPDLLESMKLLNEDHAHDGWPTVRMNEINGLIEIIERQSEQLAKANERIAELSNLIEIASSHWGVKSTLKEILEQLRKEQE